jgi:hypothetical protein
MVVPGHRCRWPGRAYGQSTPAESDYGARQASPLPGPRRTRARLPPPPGWRQPGGLTVPAGYGRLTGPLALITWWKATGGLFCTHLPPDFAPMARMLSWYLPLPVIPV